MDRLCWLIGHRDDVPWQERDRDYSPFVCHRCGGCEMDPDFRWSRHVVAFWGFRDWLSEIPCRVRNWWRPCPECGRRFDRHDYAVDHLPF